MKKFWGYLSAFLGGLASAFLITILILKNKISQATIEITRPKIKNSPEAKQDFTSQIIDAVKKSNEKLKKEIRKEKRQKRKLKKGG